MGTVNDCYLRSGLDKVENSMIRNHKLSALLTTNHSDSGTAPRYLGVVTQSAIRAADYAPSTSLSTYDPFCQRGVVDLADGGVQITPASTRSLAEKGGRLGLCALALSMIAGCAGALPSKTSVTPPPPSTAPQAKFVVFDGTLYTAKPSP